MISFSPITLDNIHQLCPYILGQPYRTCDYTIGAIFEWRAYFRSVFAIVSDMLVMRAEYPGEGSYYIYPVGFGNLADALSTIEQDAAESGRRLIFSAVPEESLTVLRARYGNDCEISSRRDWADYLYQMEDLINFPGKRYHTQRNHLNRFLKDNEDSRFVPVTAETLPLAQAFLNDYAQHVPVDKNIEAEEMIRSKELLADALTLGQKAGYIEAGGIIVALAVGEIVADTLYVHVEKARVDYAGAYQAIVSQFAAFAAEPNTKFINREDDSGEEGLRYSKLAYRPIRMIEKYWVTIK
ncbi:MAG: phosphatidylglycerol lysyltransferase domain-containing protein [Clostridia bacterium]